MKHYLYLVLLLAFTMLAYSCKEDGNGDGGEIIEPKTLDDSIQMLSDQIRQNPHDAALFVQRSDLQFINGNLDEAINDMEIAMKVDSTKPPYYSKLASLYMLKANGSEKAKEVLNKCINRYPSYPQAHIDLAKIFIYVGMFQEAMQENDIALVIVDNINIMQPPAVYQGMREQEISAISRELKFIARELNIPVIALAELSRHGRTRGYSSFANPHLEDLKESSALEYDADTIIFFCPETEYLSEDSFDRCKIRLAKNRRGHTTDFDVKYDQLTGKVKEIEEVPLEYVDSRFNEPDEPSDTTPVENPENDEF